MTLKPFSYMMIGAFAVGLIVTVIGTASVFAGF